MTQQELADLIHVRKQQVNHYVTGRRTMSLKIAVNVASVLGCDVMELYEWIPVEVRDKRQ